MSWLSFSFRHYASRAGYSGGHHCLTQHMRAVKNYRNGNALERGCEHKHGRKCGHVQGYAYAYGTIHRHLALVVLSSLMIFATVLGSSNRAMAVPTWLPEKPIMSLSATPTVFLKVMAFTSLNWRPADLDCSVHDMNQMAASMPALELWPYLVEVREEAVAAGDPDPIVSLLVICSSLTPMYAFLWTRGLKISLWSI